MLLQPLTMSSTCSRYSLPDRHTTTCEMAPSPLIWCPRRPQLEYSRQEAMMFHAVCGLSEEQDCPLPRACAYYRDRYQTPKMLSVDNIQHPRDTFFNAFRHGASRLKTQNDLLQGDENHVQTSDDKVALMLYGSVPRGVHGLPRWRWMVIRLASTQLSRLVSRNSIII